MSAFAIFGQDVGTYAFREPPSLTELSQIHQGVMPDMSGPQHSGIKRCTACGELLAKWDEPPKEIALKKLNFDFGVTYDGVKLVSKRFRSVYEQSALCGLHFWQLSGQQLFFAIQAIRTVRFDSDRRKTRFSKQCNLCGRFESVIGATPVMLKCGTEIGTHEFVRTDLEFGSNDEKSPLLLCGPVAAEVLRNEKLSGLDLEPVQELLAEQVSVGRERGPKAK
jgi:hypothetical protein